MYTCFITFHHTTKVTSFVINNYMSDCDQLQVTGKNKVMHSFGSNLGICLYIHVELNIQRAIADKIQF